ncbi:acyl-CoA synthetase [Alicyclobacillus ferrooxydans]|uniref:AMP-dependent synthetase n=1 Tax=Alicyclobacillus ferrooxydans TaxID=471514 RepID=A0A0P9CXC9_9BACL|nr:acyl-CoA synthetase [Alicyclobacillus ferrooxydans]KPV44412.1 AMP-dependent synthetase [Alicyclobacillus ferrooxydans]
MKDTYQDFWETTAQDLKNPSYQAIREAFRWDIPEFYNIAVDACDRHAANPNRLALIYDRGDGHPENWTFRDLKTSSNRLANALQGLGIRCGDRVAVFLSQSPQLPMTHFAIYKLGAIVVPLFTLFGPDAVVHRMSDSQARIVITDEEHLNLILDCQRELPDLEHVIVVDGHHSGALSLDDLLAASSDTFEPVHTKSDDPAIIIYTSGTTGKAKGALHGHRVLLGHLPGVSVSHNLMPRPNDLIWTPADWAWIGGMFDVLFPALHWAIPIVAHRMPKFDPEAAFYLMARLNVRNTFLPPTALKMMRQIEKPLDRWPLQLRTIACGGESLGEETLRWAETSLGIHINEFYGQTECNMVVSNCTDAFPSKPGSMGKAAPGHEVAIIDDDGNVVPSGTMGEIAVKSPNPVMFLRYWNQSAATDRKFVGDWLRTGDMGYMNEEGYIYFVGRDDDIISSAGYRIGPAEVEESLVQHPTVLMAAVVGIPDETRGQIVKAFVRLRDGVAADDPLRRELQQWVRQKLGAHEYPREIEFVESFPMTPSGKIQRAVLRKREAERKQAGQ